MVDVESLRLKADPEFIANCDKLVESNGGQAGVGGSARIDFMQGTLYLSTQGVIVARVAFDRRSSIERAYQAALERNGVTLCSFDIWRKNQGWDMRVYIDRAYLA